MLIKGLKYKEPKKYKVKLFNILKINIFNSFSLIIGKI